MFDLCQEFLDERPMLEPLASSYAVLRSMESVLVCACEPLLEQADVEAGETIGVPQLNWIWMATLVAIYTLTCAKNPDVFLERAALDAVRLVFESDPQLHDHMMDMCGHAAWQLTRAVVESIMSNLFVVGQIMLIRSAVHDLFGGPLGQTPPQQAVLNAAVHAQTSFEADARMVQIELFDRTMDAAQIQKLDRALKFQYMTDLDAARRERAEDEARAAQRVVAKRQEDPGAKVRARRPSRTSASATSITGIGVSQRRAASKATLPTDDPTLDDRNLAAPGLREMVDACVESIESMFRDAVTDEEIPGILARQTTFQSRAAKFMAEVDIGESELGPDDESAMASRPKSEVLRRQRRDYFFELMDGRHE
nr:hypothetical protein HK105_008212 [Polyrhizophydium stewartii]